jgi:hypothetical protein
MQGGSIKLTYLATGTYVLPSTMNFTSADNGETWSALAGQYPIVSGAGQDISTGWTGPDGNGIYARTGVNWTFRELYVSGIHAVRAGAPTGTASTAGGGSTSGWAANGSVGFTVPSAMATWGNKAYIEVASLHNWDLARCKVATIVGTALTMSQPCFGNMYNSGYYAGATWVENAYELLAGSAGGTWYLDVAGATLYYIPRAGETFTSGSLNVAIVAPKLETLISGTGVSNLTFNRISFEFENNTDADAATGWPSIQSNLACFDPAGGGGNGTNCLGVPFSSYLHWPNGALAFAPDTNGNGCQNITFQNSLFAHLGGTALFFRHGCQGAKLLANKCVDRAGFCVQWGDIEQPTQANAALQTAGLTMRNNLVSDGAFEYLGSSALYQGFALNSVIDHNEFVSTWSGIAMGWVTISNYGTGNAVTNNYIHDYCAGIFPNLGDCGGIYTGGATASTPQNTFNGNYFLRGTTGYGCIYADENSSYQAWTNSVCDRPTIAGNNYWAFLHNSTSVSVTSSWSTNANSGTTGSTTPTLQAPTLFTTGCSTIGNACNGAQAYMPPNSGIQAGVTPGP